MRNNYSYHIGEVCWILFDQFLKLDFFIVVEEEFIYNSIAHTRNVLKSSELSKGSGYACISICIFYKS